MNFPIDVRFRCSTLWLVKNLKTTVFCRDEQEKGAILCPVSQRDHRLSILFSGVKTMQPLLILLWTLLLMDPTLQVSLIVSPDQSQFFTNNPLNLRCDDTSQIQWKVWRRNQDTTRRCGDGDDNKKWGVQTGSRCIVKLLEMKDSGQYWCQSEEGNTSEPVTLSVTDRGVILQMPVHPVSAGKTVKLSCNHRTDSSKANFYKNNQFLLEDQGRNMIIQQVALSHAGLYYCEINGQKSQPTQLTVKAVSVASTLAPLTTLFLTTTTPTPSVGHSLPPWVIPVVGSVVGVFCSSSWCC
ncbi:hypothetical protein NL108_005393 [Boleophthalmus pectinirostris]|uniref:uncharacterized protein LOC110160282 n=1 Tax=Boleophthalmus pectinirostris TaxID=150288 RepID=UPI002432032C|nr:uncharacterized protein LOC110160282 [Boleophthalmus pectinirostris]KAJ0055538.1 hypothetical protein NL108_005393 [Boleophthalmus pectinirostris]